MKKTTKSLFFFALLIFLKIHSIKAQTTYTFTTYGSGSNVNVVNVPIVPSTATITWSLFNVTTGSFLPSPPPINNPVLAGLNFNQDYTLSLSVVDGTLNSVFFDSIRFGENTAINFLDYNESISIFPNPSNGEINLNSNIIKPTSVTVFNILGENVYQNNELEYKNALHLSFLRKGVYFIKIESDGKYLTKKITIAK